MTHWSDDAWRAGALEWMRRELERIGLVVTSAPDQFHVRPWSTIFRVSTRGGDVYFKAVPTQLTHEVRLTRWLADRFPDHVLPVLAADDARGFMILTDGGVRLREARADLATWRRAMTGYAQLQLALAAHVPELLALGVPDRRLASLPAALAAVWRGAPRDRLQLYASLCAELAAFGLPETLQMDDLHDGNVLVEGDRTRVFDWGDASVAHPFFCLAMVFDFVARGLRVAQDAPEVELVRDAYLEPFTALAPMESLRRAAGLAARIVPTVRILSWQLAHADPASPPDEWGETLEGLLDEQRSALA